MKRFKNILVVIDLKSRYEALIERAAILCQRNQARMTIVISAEDVLRDMPKTVAEEPVEVFTPDIDIIETLPPDISKPITSDSEDTLSLISDLQETLTTEGGIPLTWEESLDIHEQVIETEAHQLEQIIAPVQQLGVQVSCKVLHGTLSIEIIREVLRNGHDLVMIAAEDYRGLRNLLFGSTTMSLMRKCPCPVWVMKPDRPKQLRYILAAVDPDPQHEELNALNIKIMDLATSLAHRERCELLVIHTWTFPMESRLRGMHRNVPPEKIEQWIEGARKSHKRSLVKLLQQYDLEKLKHQVYLLNGIAENLIPKLAEAREVDLIVMGTVCRSGVAGLLIGNTAEKVLRQVYCSVLTVKPDGFITPVKLDA
jgi:nucleotide-binding universal stress UspA family protein